MISVYLRVIFLPSHTHVMYGIRQCHRIFSSSKISAFFAKIFFLYFICDIELNFPLPNFFHSNLILA